MKRYGFVVLLFFLRGLVYIKRAVVWFIKILGQGIVVGARAFQRTLGFRLYKLWFVIQKWLGKLRIPWDSRAIEFLGKRSMLQVAFFIVCIVVMIPHSKLYTRDTATIAGRETLLYSLVGPGNQDFDVEEVYADVTSVDQKETEAGWREGAVSATVASGVGVETPKETQEITAISAGGSALTKPSIMTGATLPTAEESLITGRTEVVIYEVQPGDVIGQIAEKYNISVNTILWANNLTARSYIRPGDQLKILPTSGLVHKVKSGDTVIKIARTYDADAADIIKANRLQKDGADIVIGEDLVIPGGEKPRPVYSSYRASAPSSIRDVAAPPPSVSAPAGSGYLWPTSVRRISQYFGWRHTGLDIAGPSGSAIYAARGGRVIKSQCGWNGGYGCYIIIDHGGGVRTLYAHHSRLYVSVGQQVSQGQTIAAMGTTGRSTGNHLHFEVIVNGRKQNPLRYIR